MDKDIGVGIIVGIIISLGFLIYNLSKKAIHKAKNKDYYKTKNNVDEFDNRLSKLENLKLQGILTDDEYYEKTTKLNSEKLMAQLKLTPEYKELKSLYDDGILTKDEFDKKVELLISGSNQKRRKSTKGKIENLFDNNFKLIKHIENNFNIRHKRNLIVSFNDNGTTTLSDGTNSFHGNFLQDEDVLSFEFTNLENEYKFLDNNWDLDFESQGFTLKRSSFTKDEKLEFDVI